MNDNRKSPLEEALDAVEQAIDASDRDYADALEGLREIVADDKRKVERRRSIH